MIKEELQTLLDRLIEARDAYELELGILPSGKLHFSRGEKYGRYYRYDEVDGEKVRKGITKDKELIEQLARKEYIIKLLAVLNNNILVLQKAVEKYTSCDPDSILESLSKTYKTLPKEAFLNSAVDSIILTLDASDARRIASHAEWGREPYEPPAYREEERTLITSRGERMRSKAEVLIAEKLYEYCIPFRYEQELNIDGVIFHPDFTFEGAGGRPLYLEFCGMMDDPHYVSSHQWKRQAYEDAGICEWDNMVYVYSAGNEMNMMHIDSIIRTRIIPKL